MKYMLLSLLAWGGTACSKDPAADATGEGSVRFDISMTQMTRSGETPDNVVIRIYRADGALIRRYTSLDELPSPLYLTAGDYRVTVEAGDKSNTAFVYTDDDDRMQKLCFSGDQDFTVKANDATTQSVVCKPLNVGASVVFDPEAENTENSRIADVQIDVAAMTLDADAADAATLFEAAVADAETPSLTFGGSGKGYFLCPEGVTALAWRFRGTHDTAGALDKLGTVTSVKAGYIYKMTFNYSLLADGKGSIHVNIDETTETKETNWTFEPDSGAPELSSDDVDLSEDAVNFYEEGSSTTFTCAAEEKLSRVTLSVETLTRAASEPVVIYDGSEPTNALEGVVVTKESEKKILIEFTEAWYAKYGTGVHTVIFGYPDVAGGNYSDTYCWATQGLLEATSADCDLWANTATFRALAFNAASVSIRYRKEGATEWNTAAATKGTDGYTWTAVTAAGWTETKNDNGYTVYLPDAEKGIFPENTYEYQLMVDGAEFGETQKLTPVTTQTIPDGGLNDSSLSCWGTSNTAADIFWGSGNNTFAKSLCTRDTSKEGREGDACAHLQASLAMGNLASGNLFTGTFTFGSPKYGDGVVGFGVSYDWQARPVSLKLKYHASIGTVNVTKYADEIASGAADQASIYVCIVDWSERHSVKSGMNGYSGVWSPEAGNNPADSEGNAVGTIIGYGTYYPKGTTEGDAMVELEIPIYYYDKTAKPSKNYTLVIGCSTSRYGDYMNGCSSNVMYVDDFRWGY